MSGCRFDMPWSGACGKDVAANGLCAEHLGLRCADHPEMQATSGCAHAGQFVCGRPCCALHTSCCCGHGRGPFAEGLPTPETYERAYAAALARTPTPDEVEAARAVLRAAGLEPS